MDDETEIKKMRTNYSKNNNIEAEILRPRHRRIQDNTLGWKRSASYVETIGIMHAAAEETNRQRGKRRQTEA